ncbi:MAG: phosphopyruvate hydratase [Planctomycetales bacterium]
MANASHLIQRLAAREVFDSRGRPTVEVEVHCAGGRMGRAIAPSGASRGRYEACELRDEGVARLRGMGVQQAVALVHELVGPALNGRDPADQSALDQMLIDLDGTPNKSRLGGNVTTAVSLACAHAAAAANDVLLVEHLHSLWRQVRSQASGRSELSVAHAGGLGEELLLPLPMVNMISGGLHAGRNLDFQDFLAVPVGAASYRQALEWIVHLYGALGKVLRDRGLEGALVGDEGGYGPRLKSNLQAVELILKAIVEAGFEPGRQIALAIDVAATHLEWEGGYRLAADTGERIWTSAELIDLYEDWIGRYPIFSLEDPLGEQHRQGWVEITRRLGDHVQIIGDDLFVTNPRLLTKGIAAGMANGVLVKVNQVGTLSETFETMRLALDAGYWPVISARSGETEDTTIADLAVATGAGQIKIGSVARSERLAKYNQLLRLEERLGSRARYLGGAIFSPLRPIYR